MIMANISRSGKKAPMAVGNVAPTSGTPIFRLWLRLRPRPELRRKNRREPHLQLTATKPRITRIARIGAANFRLLSPGGGHYSATIYAPRFRQRAQSCFDRHFDRRVCVYGLAGARGQSRPPRSGGGDGN